MFGLVLEQDDAAAPGAAPAAPALPPFHLWPCNVPVFNLWIAAGGQWRLRADGQRHALDYAAVLPLVDRWPRLGPARKRWRVFGLLRAMERAALDAWAEQSPRFQPVTPAAQPARP